MSDDTSPLSYRFQQALAPITDILRQNDDRQQLKRLSELLTLLDFNSTLNRTLGLQEILDVLLFVVMGEVRSTWAAVALRAKDGVIRPAARRGIADSAWTQTKFPARLADSFSGSMSFDEEPDSLEVRSVFQSTGARLLIPLRKDRALIGLILLGKPAGDEVDYGREARNFVEALAISAAASLDNGRVYEELRELNRRLSLKVYQLDSLFDVTQELHNARDAVRVRNILVASAMGQLLTTRCAVVQPDGAVLSRGARFSSEELSVVHREGDELRLPDTGLTLAELDSGPLKTLLETKGFQVAVPLRSGSMRSGVLLVGPRASGEPLGGEDMDFLRSLAAQGAAALDNQRLTSEWLEKQKIEKELAVAREIQRRLLPDQEPRREGWDFAGVNIPCLTVGGDYYDYLDGPRGQLGLIIADVSGKGTGPAILSALVQASLRALTGLGDIDIEVLATRLNRQIYGSTAGNKYVTLFFGWLDTENGALVYVNAGHCYPLRIAADGNIERLSVGSAVIGLLPELSVEVGRCTLDPGDLLVLYTDGLSEARSPAGEEFEEEHIIHYAQAARDSSAMQIVARLVSEARVFAAEAGLPDDLTLMVVKRQSAPS